MFGIEIIGNHEYLFCEGYVLVGEEWKRIQEMKDIKQPRTLEKLISDFESSAGNFEKFHQEMDMREKTLFKGWLNKMRREIPRFATHDEDLS